MKIKQLTYSFTIAILAVASILSSCKKDNKEVDEKDTDTSSASDQALATSISNDMVSISDEAGKTYSVSSFKTTDTEGLLSTSCATLTVDTLSSVDTLIVNFGTTDCTCNDGRSRRGILQITYSGKYKDSLTVITVTPIGYYVNENQVLGIKTITNKGHNAAHHLVYEINANVQIIKPNSGGTITWQSTRQREWITGESTLSWNDDIYSITGTAYGTSANGNTFTSTITTPLVRNMSFPCRRNFVSGVLEHTPNNKAMRKIDFGAGVCDNLATVTINGVIYNIILP